MDMRFSFEGRSKRLIAISRLMLGYKLVISCSSRSHPPPVPLPFISNIFDMRVLSLFRYLT